MINHRFNGLIITIGKYKFIAIDRGGGVLSSLLKFSVRQLNKRLFWPGHKKVVGLSAW